jgi:outer membrane protein
VSRPHLRSNKDIATMKKTTTSALVWAAFGALALALAAAPAMAQDAGTMMVKLGYNQIVPQVSSGDLSAPSMPGTQIDVKEAGAPVLTLTYMYTKDVSFEFFAGLPYEHDIMGDGAIKGVGKIGIVKQVSPTLFAQYRFLEKESRFRPYVGLGLTYVYNYGEEGSSTLTALTNPGGDPTLLEIDDAWGISPQIGATFKIDRKWYVDFSVIKTFVKTTAHLSTGQSIEAKLDPMAYNLGVGYRF